MRLDINCCGQTESFDLPSDVDWVGVKLGGWISINSDFPNSLRGSSVECNLEYKELSDGTRLTIFLYKFDGEAKVLSLKEYPGLVYCDLLIGDDLRIKITV